MRPTLLFLAAAALLATVSPAPAQSPAPTATPAAVASPAPAKLTRAEKRAQKKAAKEAAAPAATPAAAAAPTAAPIPKAPSTIPAAEAAPSPAAAASPMPAKMNRADKKAAKAAKETELANATPAPGGGPGLVWVNTKSKVYHDSSDRYYGKTKEGKYMSEKDAQAAGFRPNKEKEKAAKAPAAAN